MGRKEKAEQSNSNSSPTKRLGSSEKGVGRRFARRSNPDRMPADVLAKLIIAAVTALLLLGLLISFLVPSSQQPATKTPTKSYEEKLEYARKKRHEGKNLRRQADGSDSTTTRNDLLKQAEDILWESREAYLEIIDAHDDGEGGYDYLQNEIEDVQANIYHCQKTRTVVEFE